MAGGGWGEGPGTEVEVRRVAGKGALISQLHVG